MSTIESQSNNRKIYTPPVWRLLVVYFMLPVIAVFVGSILKYLPDILNGSLEKWLDDSDLLIYSAIAWAVVSLLLVGFKRDWFAIEINGVSISGQANFGGRKVLLLKELDMKKIEQGTMIHKWFDDWKIWDIKGNKIVINGWFFRKDQISDILKTIGFDSKL